MVITIDVRNKICKLRTSRTISGLALFKSASPMSIKNRRALSVPELQTTDYSAIKTSSDGNCLFNALSFGITGSNIRFHDFTYCIVHRNLS